MIRKAFALLIWLALAVPAFAVDTYFASASAGSNNGTSCANAYAYNDGTNGWNTAGKQDADDVTHVCGTITGTTNAVIMTINHSGTSGHPITVIFESGAIIQAAYFPSRTGSSACGGAICATGQSWVVIDGNSTGTVRNTANGTIRANQHVSELIDVHATSNITVKGLSLLDTYVRTSATDSSIDETEMNAIEVSGSNNLLTHLTIDQCGWCLFNSVTNGDTTNEYSFITFTNTAHSMMVAAAGAFAATDYLIHDNDISGPGTTWDGAGCPYHQDGLHVFGTSGSSFDNFSFYNNYMHGDWGACPTGWVFVEAAGSGTPSNMQNSKWYNNLGIVSDTGQIVNTNGWFTVASGDSGTQLVANNTFIGPNNSDNTNCLILQGLSGVSVRNNVITRCGDPIRIDSSTLGTVNTNLYGTTCGNGGNCFIWNGSFTGSFAAWKTACSCDSSAVQDSTPDINLTDGTLNMGSSAIGLGANLTALGVTPLNSDKTGSARPGGATAWDAGAFNSGSSPSCTPSKVVFTAQPGSTTLGGTLGTISVAVQDSGSVTCTSDTSTVTLAKTGGTCTGMTLNGTVSGAATAGVFTTTDVNMTVATGACTLTATDGALTSAVSSSFTISAAATGANRSRVGR